MGDQPIRETPQVQELQNERFRRFIETEVLRILKDLSSNSETDPSLIQEIAAYTLDKIKPEMKVQELFSSAVALDDKYSQLSPVVASVLQEYEQTYEHPAIDHVETLIRAGNYGKAEELMTKVLSFKMLE